MKTECKRHGVRHVSERRADDIWVWIRCAHLGRRFVVEQRCTADRVCIFLDYVEDLEIDTPGDMWGVIVEAHSPEIEDVDALWDELNKKMLSGVGPKE